VTEAKRIEDLTLEELAHTERVEAELDAFLEKRAREARDQGRIDELWTKTVREYHAKHRNENAQRWHDYHDRLLRSHEDTLGSLILYHRKERARYARILGQPITEKATVVKDQEFRA
jgi:hypothetical protein